ncbi:hypothetical protein EDB84DRAFT_1515886, partial [Lactarius hengduanensis]
MSNLAAPDTSLANPFGFAPRVHPRHTHHNHAHPFTSPASHNLLPRKARGGRGRRCTTAPGHSLSYRETLRGLSRHGRAAPHEATSAASAPPHADKCPYSSGLRAAPTRREPPRAHGAARAPRRTLPHRAPQPRRRADALGSSHDARGTPTPPATLLPRRQRVSRGHARAHQRPESHVRPALPRPLRPRGAALPRGGRRRDSEVPVPRCGAALRRRDRLRVSRRALDWQLASLAQICGALTPLFAHVEGLTLGLHTSRPKPDANSDCSDSDRAQWHALLRAFGGTKTLQLAGPHAAHLLHELLPLPSELLPALQELLPGDDGEPGAGEDDEGGLAALRDALWVSSVIGGEVRSTVLVLCRFAARNESFLYSCSRCLLSDIPLYFYSITILRVSPA